MTRSDAPHPPSGPHPPPVLHAPSGPQPSGRPRGVFAGLATLDVIHRIDAPPGADEKVTARAQFVAAGGPAANAAVAFAALGGEAVLLTALGSGTIARTIADELASCGVEVHDMAPDLHDAAPVSSVAVLEATGERSVVGGDAAGLEVPAPDPEQIAHVLDGADVVLLDGHHPQLARTVLAAARTARLPIVLDAGRWKPVMEELVGTVTDAVTSQGFRLPGTGTAEESAAEALRRGARVVATTAGPGPVHWWAAGADGGAASDEGADAGGCGAPAVRSGAVTVPTVQAVDTLGAGDVFHGAYAYALAGGAGIERRLGIAAQAAAIRCSMVGPRSWLDALAQMDVTVRSDGRELIEDSKLL